MRSRFALLVSAIFAMACSVQARPSDVPGTYVMNQGRAADTLWIKPGGTYAHLYRYPGAAPILRRGSWTWGSVDEFAAIEVDDFIMLSRRESFPSANRSTGGIWPAPIERSPLTGAVFIPVDDDTGWAYERVSAAQIGSGGK